MPESSVVIEELQDDGGDNDADDDDADSDGDGDADAHSPCAHGGGKAGDDDDDTTRNTEKEEDGEEGAEEEARVHDPVVSDSEGEIWDDQSQAKVRFTSKLQDCRARCFFFHCSFLSFHAMMVSA